MKSLLVTSALMAGLLPSTLLAEPLSFSGGVTVTSNYVADGLSQTDNGPAIQPYLEIGKDGLYAGAWASNLNDEAGNRAELDLSLGYRGKTGSSLEYDLGYTQHFYDMVHDNSSEMAMSVGTPISDVFSVTGEVSYDLVERTFGTSVTVEAALSDVWTAHASLGRTDPTASVNWAAGIAYSLSDQTKIDIAMQDTASTSPLFALSLNYAFGDASN